MTLTPGTRLGPYEIVSPLGAGGMGEVYRATDTTLDRAVAIKVLPESFALDADRVARFTREAKMLAALNHPNIAQVFGVEQQGSTRALVMELVEGDDLSHRIAQGAMPIEDALPIAKQIADALEAAHEQAIIHRDLKPANIKVRTDGTVKVLDFGLAKAMDPNVGRGFSRADGGLADPGAAKATPYGSPYESPTMTSPAMTAMGMIMGAAGGAGCRLQRIPEGTIHPIQQRNYDVMPDGKRLIVVLPAADAKDKTARVESAQINVVLNWFQELRARAPVK